MRLASMLIINLSHNVSNVKVKTRFIFRKVTNQPNQINAGLIITREDAFSDHISFSSFYFEELVNISKRN